jgi:hypothetical protein
MIYRIISIHEEILKDLQGAYSSLGNLHLSPTYHKNIADLTRDCYLSIDKLSQVNKDGYILTMACQEVFSFGRNVSQYDEILIWILSRSHFENLIKYYSILRVRKEDKKNINQMIKNICFKILRSIDDTTLHIGEENVNKLIKDSHISPDNMNKSLF